MLRVTQLPVASASAGGVLAPHQNHLRHTLSMQFPGPPALVCAQNPCEGGPGSCIFKKVHRVIQRHPRVWDPLRKQAWKQWAKGPASCERAVIESG